MDESGEQMAFGITRAGDAPAAIEAYGILWNRAAGLDVTFEIPEGLADVLPLGADQLTGTGLDRLATTRIPATFTDRTDGLQTNTHPGTATFVIEGAGDVNGLTSIAESFVPETQDWGADFLATTATKWRLAQASISLDCPELGIFQEVVADWETDLAQIYYGTPLSINMSASTDLLLTAR